MFDLPYQNTPCNFPEEERLMKRLYRTLSVVEVFSAATWKKQPRLSRDLEGFFHLLNRFTHQRVRVDDYNAVCAYPKRFCDNT